MNAQAFPLVAVVVLSFLNKINTWWGILVMVICCVLGLLSASAKERSSDPFAPDSRSGSVGEFAYVTVPAFIAALIGHFIWHGWGALIGGVGVALAASAASALLMQPE